MRAIRKFVRQELKLPAERYELVGYWTAQGEEWDAKWDALDPAIKAQIDAAWDSDRDPEEVRDEYEAVPSGYDHRPTNLASRFSRKAATPSR